MSKNTMLNPYLSYQLEHLGKEQQPLVIIDNFVKNPQGLLDYAIQQHDVLPVTGHRPGLRSAAPLAYCTALSKELEPFLSDVFGLQRGQFCQIDSYYSLVCTPLEQLSLEQRMPNFEQAKTHELAVIHYLCGVQHGGTSFYRHRSSGYEYIDQHRSAKYQKSMKKDIQQFGMPRQPSYINGDNVFFERIKSVAAVFNRALIYRCSSLHAGDIPENYQFDGNPLTGRFTLASFIHG